MSYRQVLPLESEDRHKNEALFAREVEKYEEIRRQNMLEIKDLHANVAGREILRGIDLRVGAGEVHAIMGPNGSGKSTLASVLAGNPRYEVTGGTVLFSSGIQAPDAEHDMSSRAADSRLSQEDVASTRLSSEMGSYNAVDGVREGVYPDVNDRANFETKAADARLSRQIDLLALSIEERAREGIFLGFQYPVEIPGVSMANFMKAAVAERRKHLGLEPLSAAAFLKTMREKAALVELDPAMISRAVNEGFSGGEKKKNEIFQMAMLEPRLAVLDETDSGLDIDALRIVGEGVSKLRRPDNAIVLITHYQRLLDYIVPDFVHVLYKGRIIISGDRDLALKLEKEGYDWLISKS